MFYPNSEHPPWVDFTSFEICFLFLSLSILYTPVPLLPLYSGTFCSNQENNYEFCVHQVTVKSLYALSFHCLLFLHFSLHFSHAWHTTVYRPQTIHTTLRWSYLFSFEITRYSILSPWISFLMHDHHSGPRTQIPTWLPPIAIWITIPEQGRIMWRILWLSI